MGTWGTGPFDNDSAADLIAGLAVPVRRLLDAKTPRTARKFYEEARAGASLVAAAHGTDILSGPQLTDVVRAIAKIRSDDDWIAGFREPEDIARALDRELRALIRHVQRCAQCGESGCDEARAAIKRRVPTSHHPYARSQAHAPKRKPISKRRNGRVGSSR